LTNEEILTPEDYFKEESQPPTDADILADLYPTVARGFKRRGPVSKEAVESGVQRLTVSEKLELARLLDGYVAAPNDEQWIYTSQNGILGRKPHTSGSGVLTAPLPPSLVQVPASAASVNLSALHSRARQAEEAKAVGAVKTNEDFTSVRVTVRAGMEDSQQEVSAAISLAYASEGDRPVAVDVECAEVDVPTALALRQELEEALSSADLAEAIKSSFE